MTALGMRLHEPSGAPESGPPVSGEKARGRPVNTVMARELRNVLTGGSDPRSLSSKMRRRRFAALLTAFPTLADMAVVDLGGRPATWLQAPVRPRRVVCVNIEPHTSTEPWLETVVADACDPQLASQLGSFDLAYSNSTIEHVGGHVQRLSFARTIQALAPCYWVQTPNRYFPVEPHAVLPMFQFLPTRAKVMLARRWPLSPLGTDGDLVDEVLGIELLSATELRFYFPGAHIWKERVAGLTKSLSAYLPAHATRSCSYHPTP
jgi:hypothetical protein